MGFGVRSTAFAAALASACVSMPSDPRARERETLVYRLAADGIADTAVLRAMNAVPRHLFVPAPEAAHAYEDRPLPIGGGQTISQPYIVAFMTETLGLSGDEKVLEIGTGSGYQAAVLGRLAHQVYTIEIVPELASRAQEVLRRLGFGNVHVRAGDGYRGWPEQAPFDAIVVTAAPGHVPKPLVDQLAIGGRMVLPVGEVFQDLLLITRDEQGVHEERLIGVRFVPMTGEAERGERGTAP